MKKYTCPLNTFGFYVKVDGREVQVQFLPIDRQRSLDSSIFMTADAALQAAIEASPHYGVRIFEVPTKNEVVPILVPEPPTLVPGPQVVPVVETPMDTPVKKKVKADVPKGDAADSTLI